MTTPLTTTDESAARCPGCGYSFAGLPRGHPCPECGETLPPDTTVLWGKGHTERPRRGFSVITGLLLGLGTYGFLMLLGRRFGDWLAITGGCLMLAAHYWWTKAMQDKRLPGPMQLRLNQSGYGTRSGFGHVRMRPWKCGWKVQVHHHEFSPKRTISVYRPLLGMLVLSEPLKFTAEMSFVEANDLAARIRRWISDYPAAASARAGAVGADET